MPKVSVIIPAYNAISFLQLAVDSVKSQTFTDYEIIIVDDGSTDNTVNWISSLNDPYIHLIVQSNKRAAGARNTGIDIATGEYLAFLDADDLWEPTKLEKQVEYLNTRPKFGLVHCWISNINEAGTTIGSVMKGSGEGLIWEEVVTYNPVHCGSTSLVRRKCFEELGKFDQGFKYAEDWDMWIRISKNYSIGVIKEPLVKYRLHDNNKSKNYELWLQSCLAIIDKAFQDKTSYSQDLKCKALSNIYLSAAWKAYYLNEYQQCIELKNKSIMSGTYPTYLGNYIHLSLKLLSIKIPIFKYITDLVISIKNIKNLLLH